MHFFKKKKKCFNLSFALAIQRILLHAPVYLYCPWITGPSSHQTVQISAHSEVFQKQSMNVWRLHLHQNIPRILSLPCCSNSCRLYCLNSARKLKEAHQALKLPDLGTVESVKIIKMRPDAPQFSYCIHAAKCKDAPPPAERYATYNSAQQSALREEASRCIFKRLSLQTFPTGIGTDPKTKDMSALRRQCPYASSGLEQSMIWNREGVTSLSGTFESAHIRMSLKTWENKQLGLT